MPNIFHSVTWKQKMFPFWTKHATVSNNVQLEKRCTTRSNWSDFPFLVKKKNDILNNKGEGCKPHP